MTPQAFLSFASDQGFLGAVVVDTVDFTEALARVNALGLNPGGEIAFWLVEPGKYPLEKLLGQEELAAAQGGYFRLLGDVPPEERAFVEACAEFIHEGCNRPRLA